MSETMWLERNAACSVDEDARLAVAARENPAQFRPLYEKWLPRIYRYFYFRVETEKDAEDLTSQVFLRACEALPRYRDTARFSTWLFTIAHARMVDYHRRRRRFVSLEAVTENPSGENLTALYDQHEDIQRMFQLLKGLKDDEQELIRLRFAADLSYAEIGEILHKNEDAVRKSVARMIQRLQAQMEVKND